MSRARSPHLQLAALLIAASAIHATESAASFDPPELNFPGIAHEDGGSNPPDTVGDVGANHYVQMTNGANGNSALVWIFDKRDGTPLEGPFGLQKLSEDEVCGAGTGSDPIVLYDELADRWLMGHLYSQISPTRRGLCVFISRTPEPTANADDWYSYRFETAAVPDYPKFAVWPDAYYVGANDVITTGEPAVYALDRTNMLQGLPARPYQRVTLPPLGGSVIEPVTPSDFDGPPPPEGSPVFIMRHRDDEIHDADPNDPTRDFLEIWAFSVDFDVPSNTLEQLPSIPTSEFDSHLCGTSGSRGTCFPQPGTDKPLSPIWEPIMWRLQYRNFETHETLVGSFTVDVDGNDHGGIRWFELRRMPPGSGDWTLFQEGTYAPDSDHRWMGSISMDEAGNLALGYSVSSEETFPSIHYTGRLASDPLGVMTIDEVHVVDGEFSQISHSSALNRWGDYTSMNVDPFDGCTFWYTNQYVKSDDTTPFGSGPWATQIARFSFPECFDPDGDGWTKDVDNCTEIANPVQCDTDGDGYGNFCDGDFNGDSFVDGNDANILVLDYQEGIDSGVGTDMNCDGILSPADITLFGSQFERGSPGPSALTIDTDEDGIRDGVDNCIEIANVTQCDTDDDGHGNRCDGDFDQNGFVDGNDANIFAVDFQAGVDSGVGTDMNCDGVVSPADFDLFEEQFEIGTPGPSAISLDQDADGVLDVSDNCTDVANGSQCDTDADGYGNHCDGDFNQNGWVTGTDYVNYLQPDLQSGIDSGTGTDMNCNGFVNANDLNLFVPQFESGVPGPSGLACAGQSPCP